MVRVGDFRASGSGNIIYDPKKIPKECIQIAFNTSKKLQLQSAAYDFVFLKEAPKIVEVSYGFSQSAYLSCPGYWDESLNWFDDKVTPEFFIIADLLETI